MTSQFNVLTDQDIIDSINLESPIVRAVSCGVQSRLVVLRIQNDQAAQSIQKVAKALRTLDIQIPAIYKFDQAREYQIFITLSHSIPSDSLSQKFQDWLSLFDISTDLVKVISANDPIEIPLQWGFSLVNQELKEILRRDQISADAALQLVLKKFEQTLDADSLLNQIDQQLGCSENSKNLKQTENRTSTVFDQAVSIDQSADVLTTLPIFRSSRIAKAKHFADDNYKKKRHLVFSNRATQHSLFRHLAGSILVRGDPKTGATVLYEISYVSAA